MPDQLNRILLLFIIYIITGIMVLVASGGLFMAIMWMVLPFIILAFLLWLLPHWKKHDAV